jgi:hypothetical protein
MTTSTVIEEAKDKSLNLLKNLITEKGFIASANDIDNYKRVFSRDGIIAGLSSLNFNDKELIDGFERTLITLKKHQDHTGRIPSNVSLDEQKISYGTTVGRVDATLWYIIGACKFGLEKNDAEFLENFKDSVEKAVFYAECLELNGRGLIYVPPGGDWADEYINEGYVLFDQMLYLYALKFYQKTYSVDLSEKIERLEDLVQINFFPSKENIDNPAVYQQKIFEKTLEKYTGPVSIPSFSAFGSNNYDDLFAIALVLENDLVDESKKSEIVEYLNNKHSNIFPIMPAFHPVIDENSPDWEKLKHNQLFRFKNEPYHYHNGGCWPVAYGFYLHTKPNIEIEEVEKFAETLKRDDYIFPEFYHGQNFEALGTKQLGFTAAGYLLAYQNLVNNKGVLKF